MLDCECLLLTRSLRGQGPVSFIFVSSVFCMVASPLQGLLSILPLGVGLYYKPGGWDTQVKSLPHPYFTTEETGSEKYSDLLQQEEQTVTRLQATCVSAFLVTVRWGGDLHYAAPWVLAAAQGFGGHLSNHMSELGKGKMLV